jgi:hypothetical protein
MWETRLTAISRLARQFVSLNAQEFLLTCVVGFGRRIFIPVRSGDHSKEAHHIGSVSITTDLK